MFEANASAATPLRGRRPEGTEPGSDPVRWWQRSVSDGARWSAEDERVRVLQFIRVVLAAPAGARLAAGAEDAAEPETLAALGEAGMLDLVQAGQCLAAWGEWLRLRGIEALYQSRRRLGSRDTELLANITDEQDLAAASLDLQEATDDLAGRSVIAEVAATCGVSEYAVGRRLDSALELNRLPDTWEALRRGEIDWPKVQSITDATRPLGEAGARAVEAMCLPGAGRQGTRALQTSLAKAVIVVDPGGAQRRAELARATRGVSFRMGHDATPDGMGEMTCRVSAPDLLGLRADLDVLAHAAKTPRDSRTLNQRRADVLVDLFANAVTREPTRPSSDTPASSDPPAARASSDTADTEAAPGASATSATAAASTTAATSACSDAAGASATPGTPARSEAMSAAAAAPSGLGPVSGEREYRLNPVVLPIPRRNRDDPGSCAAQSATGEPGTVAAAGAWSSRPQIVVTVGLETLLGGNEAPGDLAGYGPITAGMARDLAARGAWRCAVVDGRHGTILGLGRSTFSPRYRPPEATARLVRLREQTCVFAGCRRQAGRCDLDHRIPYSRGGATCECNLQPLCRNHHRLKHEAGFRVRMSDDPDDPWGTLVWTTPSGAEVPRYPPGADAPVTAVAGRSRLPDQPPF